MLESTVISTQLCLYMRFDRDLNLFGIPLGAWGEGGQGELVFFTVSVSLFVNQ